MKKIIWVLFVISFGLSAFALPTSHIKKMTIESVDRMLPDLKNKQVEVTGRVYMTTVLAAFGVDFLLSVEKGVLKDFPNESRSFRGVRVVERLRNFVEMYVANPESFSSMPPSLGLSVKSAKRDFPNSSAVDILEQALWRCENLGSCK